MWDTGIGIPQHRWDDIFQEFLQKDNPERDRQGPGLGYRAPAGERDGGHNCRVALATGPGLGAAFDGCVGRRALEDVLRFEDRSLRGLHVLAIDDD